MRYKPLSVVLFITLVCGLSFRSNFAHPALAQAAHAKWTVMVYIAADNNLEPNSVINLMEMAAVGSTPDVNIVVQITRPPTYTGFYGEWGGTRRFLVSHSDGGLSSGDFQISPGRLADYLNTTAADANMTSADVAQITRGTRAVQEKAALQASVPPIETQTTLTPLQIKSTQDLGGEVNSGSGAALSDFGTWAVQTYPADHYGLIMWDHGGGWSMIASDDTLNPPGITMPDFHSALDTITKASGQKFAFIGFDACLMAQLPVAVTIQPYADYEIGAEELVPGFGWDYTAPLKALVADPTLSVPDFGKAAVNAFNTLYSSTEKDASQTYDLGVIDLSKVDAVTSALSSFNDAVKATTDHEVEVIGTARANAQLFGQIGESADDTASISSVDLSDFMRLMANLTKDATVKTSANAVIQTISQMVVYHKASASLPHANGLSIFFPENSDTFTAADGSRYQQEFGTTLATWQDFLDTFYGVAHTAAQANKLTIHVTSVSATDQKPGSIHDTPVITYDMDGKNITDVSAFIIYQPDAKTNVVLDTFPITSTVTAADGTLVNDYTDGQSSNELDWNTKVPKLSDGKNALLVLMTTDAKDTQHGFIRGTYTNKRTGKSATATLLIDLDTYQSSGLWAAQDTTSTNHTVAEIFPKPGDTFEPSNLQISDAGDTQRVPSGTKLSFGKDPFSVTDAPAPDGKYSVVLQVTDASGTNAVDTATLNIHNSGLDATLQGFKDLGSGVSFLYPFDWTDVQTYQGKDGIDTLSVTDQSGDLVLNVLNYGDLTSLQDADGKAQDLIKSITGATVGTTSTVQVGTSPGSATTYQYTDTDGNQIDGTVVAVYVSDTKVSYVLQLEVPDSKADSAKPVLDEVLKSIQFFAPTP